MEIPQKAAVSLDLPDLHQELSQVQQHLHSIYQRLTGEYGDAHIASYRAYEAAASVQRLMWQIDRQARPDQALEEMYDTVEAHVSRP